MTKLRYKLGYFSNFLSGLNKPGGFRILIFHHIDDMKAFENIISFLKKNYNILDPAEINLKNNHKTWKNIVLSFDDGFYSNITAVRKILNPRKIKCLFFIPTSFISSNGNKREEILKNIFPNKEEFKNLKPMSWEDLRFLIKTGYTIGSHTLSHKNLSSIKNKEKIKEEVINSKNLLEKKLNAKIRWFAYPLEREKINATTHSLIKKTYNFCCMGLRGKNLSNQNPYCLWRDVINLDMPLNYIKFILEGGLDIYYLFKRRKARKIIRKI